MKFINKNIHVLVCFCIAACLTTTATAQNTPIITETAPSGAVNEIGVLPNLPTQQSDHYNYFRTFKPLVPIPNSLSVTESSPPEQVQITTTYKDGFNKPLQTFIRNFSSNTNKHLVIPMESRSQPGRKYNYLPYATSADISTGPDELTNYYYNAGVSQKAYYANLFPGEGYTSYSGLINQSSSTLRKEMSLLPGKSQIGQTKGKAFTKKGNDASTIKKWVIDNNGMPVSTAFYAPDELFGTEITEPDNSYGIYFTDKDERLIYKKVQLKTTPIEYAEMYYVYDGLGRLRVTITPKAITEMGSSAPSQQILDNLCFQYDYDQKGRLRSAQKPGEVGKTFFVYDRVDRICMSQNPLERENTKWNIAYFDKIGRNIATSRLTDNHDREYWQNQIDDLSIAPTSSSILFYILSGEGIYPTENGVAGNLMTSYTYFDSYNQTLDNNGNIYSLLENTQLFQNDLLSTPGAEIPTRSMLTQNLVTGTKSRIEKSDHAPAALGDWKHTVNYYDNKGRLVHIAEFTKLANQGQMDYHTAKFISTQYDWLGRGILSKQTVNNILSLEGRNTNSELYLQQYEQTSGRLTQVSHKINNGPWKTLATYTYDELGRGKRKVIGDNGEVQDFDYNIRGQLLGINKVYAETGNKQGQNRTFGQSLKYDYGFSVPKYDGKISGMVWRGAGNNAKAMAYGYGYDVGDRLTSADFRENVSGTTWSKLQTDYTVSNLTYDVSGNLLSMNQRGMGFVNGTVVPVDMDRLDYNYNPSSNQLLTVEDTVTNNYDNGDFINNNNVTPDYKYDKNGNLTQDLNRKIENIKYNFQNLPTKILFTNGSWIEYSYDVAGDKLEQLVFNIQNSSIKKTDYLGNLVYKNDTLQYFGTPNGRAIFNIPDGTAKEEYFIKDNIGNVRSVIDVLNYPILQYLATYELASANLENLFFDHLNEVRDDKPGTQTASDSQAGRLNAAEPDRQVGTSMLMKVMAGDKVEMNVNCFYEDFDPESDNISAEEMLNTIVSTLTTGSGGFQGSESHNAAMVDKLFTPSNYLNVFNNIVENNTDPTKPRAYLNYILFNERMEVVSSSSGAFQVNGANSWSPIGTTQPLEIPENGYLAIYLNNYVIRDVFFDQLSIKINRSRLKEENHYYPFGLPMGKIGSVASGFLENKAKYQGNENEKDLGLNQMDFTFRGYDAQIGRFTGIDLLAENVDIMSPYVAMNNDPVQFVDPLGLLIFNGDVKGAGTEAEPFCLDEIVIVGDGSSKVNPNPGGGNDPLAPFLPPPPNWGSGGSGSLGNGIKDTGGGGGGGSSSTTANKAPSNIPGVPGGSPTGGPTGTTNPSNGESGKGTNANSTAPGVSNGNNLAAVALTWIALDESTPDPTDVIPLKQIVYGTFTLGVAIGSSDAVRKMAQEIERILSKTRPNRQGYVYELRVNRSGLYHDVRGNSVWLNQGDIWKYGESTQKDRYSSTKLDNMIPGGVTLKQIYTGNIMEIKIYEKYCIYGYFLNHLSLPPGNRIFR